MIENWWRRLSEEVPPLAFAVECGNAEIVELLVERDAELFAEVFQEQKRKLNPIPRRIGRR
ncbi:hypothetical protein E3J79_00990 [Candidatus Dependentiae bacterium]|nr:MAG: hypothetical protein E3J79_00990 [Candidatus Dependentiae bacterium]